MPTKLENARSKARAKVISRRSRRHAGSTKTSGKSRAGRSAKVRKSAREQRLKYLNRRDQRTLPLYNKFMAEANAELRESSPDNPTRPATRSSGLSPYMVPTVASAPTYTSDVPPRITGMHGNVAHSYATPTRPATRPSSLSPYMVPTVASAPTQQLKTSALSIFDDQDDQPLLNSAELDTNPTGIDMHPVALQRKPSVLQRGATKQEDATLVRGPSTGRITTNRRRRRLPGRLLGSIQRRQRTGASGLSGLNRWAGLSLGERRDVLNQNNCSQYDNDSLFCERAVKCRYNRSKKKCERRNGNTVESELALRRQIMGANESGDDSDESWLSSSPSEDESNDEPNASKGASKRSAPDLLLDWAKTEKRKMKLKPKPKRRALSKARMARAKQALSSTLLKKRKAPGAKANTIGRGRKPNSWVQSIAMARQELGIHGFVPYTKGTPLYIRAKEIQESL